MHVDVHVVVVVVEALIIRSGSHRPIWVDVPFLIVPTVAVPHDRVAVSHIVVQTLVVPLRLELASRSVEEPLLVRSAVARVHVYVAVVVVVVQAVVVVLGLQFSGGGTCWLGHLRVESALRVDPFLVRPAVAVVHVDIHRVVVVVEALSIMLGTHRSIRVDVPLLVPSPVAWMHVHVAVAVVVVQTLVVVLRLELATGREEPLLVRSTVAWMHVHVVVVVVVVQAVGVVLGLQLSGHRRLLAEHEARELWVNLPSETKSLVRQNRPIAAALRPDGQLHGRRTRRSHRRHRVHVRELQGRSHRGEEFVLLDEGRRPVY